ncbi:MAG: YHS domain-containing (seleno)protein [Pseudomonadota bacterium]
MFVRTIISALLILTTVACASIEKRTFSTEEGAIRGYDPVAYFTAGKPVKGKSSLTTQHGTGVYHFSSQEHLDLFEQNPDKYAPQYGGFCAYAMSKGFDVSSDPAAWTIRDDKLYLNYSLGVRKTWLKKPDEYIVKADKNWAKKS